MLTNIARDYRELVELKFQLYNGLFLTLPMEAVEETGVMIPLLQEACDLGFKNGKRPDQIIDEFFNRHKPEYTQQERISFLFQVIQFVERQIVLVDALEDAAYNKIHRIVGPESWNHLNEKIKSEALTTEVNKILSQFGTRVVLTAHPTQFYPETILMIINDLREAIIENRTADVQDIIQQLASTPFYKKEKPKPIDEAERLISYLEHVFYHAVGQLIDDISEDYSGAINENKDIIQLGFWPGGDRDGNPFVTVNTTRKVAANLRQAIIGCYYKDIKKLRRRLTFVHVYDRLKNLENLLREEMAIIDGSTSLDYMWFIDEIHSIEEEVTGQYKGLFVDLIQSFRRKVESFKFHFASLDLRQDSRVLARVLNEVYDQYPNLFPKSFTSMNESDQINVLLKIKGSVDPDYFADGVTQDTLKSFRVIKEIQEANGECGANRYIISNCSGALDMSRLIALFRLNGWDDEKLTVDIVPLFETVDDLEGAAESMDSIYNNEYYAEHLKQRGNRQTVMLGFSDGTKDGGYLMANWGIFRAKEEITEISRKNKVEVIFFDGRGGPPARGGGNSHMFYSGMGKSVESKEIQLTLQGQTISSHYGIIDAAVHNLEMFITAGIKNELFGETNTLSSKQRELIQTMAETSYKKYMEFKDHPLFVPYLLEKSTLKYYGETNIGSRPTSRGKGKEFNFNDIRAIPFVGAWSQLKQNVPGFYGLGSALKEQEDLGKLEECKDLYRKSTLFRALISNSMQSMAKTNFSITEYMKDDAKFGEFWQIIYDEFALTRDMVLKVSGMSRLVEDNARSMRSIRLREQIVQPLLAIQQNALINIQKLQDQEGTEELRDAYAKMVIRSLFGNINASRNSV